MAKFLDPYNLRKEIGKIFTEATQVIRIVSPYIKLDKSIKYSLLKHVHNSEFKIELLFGKNEQDKAKSLSTFDIEFFKQFHNIEIRYNENLHAKYYANECKSIITSLNLHTFSLQNNIEVGVLFERKFGAGIVNMISNNLAKDYNTDLESYQYFDEVFHNSDIVYRKNEKEKKSFLDFFSKNENEKIEIDNSSNFYSEVKVNHQTKNKTYNKKGYCIRTGVEIDFNIKKPFSYEAFKSWSQHNNKAYRENYCHFSGEPSNGDTSFSSPVLRRYYAEAKKLEKELGY